MKNIIKAALVLLLFGFSLNLNGQFIKDVQVAEKVENVSAQTFLNKINSEKRLQLIDIRTMGEYNSGHLKNSSLINYYNPNFAKNIEAAGYNKSLPVYIYCRSGNRSGRAIKMFKRLGFKHIINLVYGINDWKRSGYSLEK